MSMELSSGDPSTGPGAAAPGCYSRFSTCVGMHVAWTSSGYLNKFSKPVFPTSRIQTLARYIPFKWVLISRCC